MFIEVARRADPDFVLGEDNRLAVAETCRLNQGIPLGILIAAAWVDVFSAAQILQEIQRSLDFLTVDWRDLPDRQRSLRATFDHSWRLLRPSEGAVFLRLSVLRGSFMFGRAQELAGASADILKNLVEQSLLQSAGNGRFRMHDLLRQYAQEKLAAQPAEYRETHLAYCQIFLEALAAWESDLKSAKQPTVLAEIDLEFADILAAWQWAVANQQVDLLGKAVEPLSYYYHLRGLFAEGIALFQSAIQHLEQDGLTVSNQRLWACLGIWLAHFWGHQADYEQARRVITRVERMLEQWGGTEAGLRRELAMLHLTIGDVIDFGVGNRLVALEHYQRGLELMFAGEDPWDISYALLRNAFGHGQAGNVRKIGWFAEQAMAIQGARGDPFLLWEIMTQREYFHMLLGEYEAAWQVVQEQIASLARTHNRVNQSLTNDHLGLALFYAGQYEQARTLLEEAIRAYTQPEETPYRLFDQYILANIYLLTGDYDAVLQDADFSKEVIANNATYDTGIYKGLVYLLSSSWDQAEQEFIRYLDSVKSLPRLDLLGYPLALLGYIAYRRGDRVTALDYLEQAVVNGTEIGFYWVYLIALSVLALILAEAGDLDQAVALYATVIAHPSAGNSRWFEDLFGKPLAALSADLPDQVRAEAQARGRRRSLSAAGQETLDRLRASPGMRDELFSR